MLSNRPSSSSLERPETAVLDDHPPKKTFASSSLDSNNKNHQSEFLEEADTKPPLPRTDGGPFPGDDDFDEDNAPVHFVVNEWAQGTSIHGVPFVTDAYMWLPWKRIMWVVLVCASSGFMIWQISTLIQQYRSYEVITDTETINPTSLEFPQVTICNMNTVSRSRMERHGITDAKTAAELAKISFPLHEFIAMAWYNGREIDVKESFKPIVMEWGACWQFTTDQRVYRTGFYGGLKIWADLRQDDYDLISDFAGAAVWTQLNGTLITSQLPVFAIKAGQETVVNIQKTEFEREKQLPWARCKSKAPEYTQTRCRSECYNQAIVKQCGCRRYSDMIAPRSVRYCSRPFFFGPDTICADKVMQNETLVLAECDCDLPSCSLIEYEGNVAEAARSEVFLDNFNYTEWNTNRSYIEKNWISVTINYEKLQYNLLTESKAMSFADLLASIGGSMGLFLGISMLSIFELLGDLGLLRLVPRLFGRKQLYGMGARKHD